MKEKINKKEVLGKIKGFFEKDNFKAEEVRKIKRLSMKFNLKLGENRKKFCKKCLSKLEGKVRIKNGFKNVECKNCNFVNRYKI
ncbi:MAG: hypothetical protein AABY10_05810 [Nanoarchaeota archaeon]